MIRKVAGWIELVIGFLVTIASIIGMLMAKSLTKINIPESISVPIQGEEVIIGGLGEILSKILIIIPAIIIAYSLIILVLGVHILLEGLSKLDSNGEKNERSKERNKEN